MNAPPRIEDLSVDDLVGISEHLINKERYEQSTWFSSVALLKDPLRQDALIHVGTALVSLKEFDAAREAILDAIRLNATHPGAWFPLAIMYRLMRRFEDERTCLEIVLAQNAPNHKDLVLIAMALNSQYLGEDARALSEYRQAELANPKNESARFFSGIMQMKLGQWVHGLANYEARLGPHPIYWPSEDIPKWTYGGNVASKGRILVCAEQGVGDIFQYARYGKFLKETLGYHHLGLFCPNEGLAPILSKWPGWDAIYTPSSGSLPEFDMQVAMMSVPLLLHSLGWNPFLGPVRPDVSCTRLPYGFKGRAGLCWRGNPDHPNDQFRSIHDISQVKLLADTLSRANLCPYCFQADPTNPEKDALRYFLGWPKLATWTETATALLGLELLITCDTAVAHLAGSLGVRTWLLLPVNSDFRWGIESSTTMWYDSMRLFRQKKIGEWGPVIDEVIRELKAI